MQSQNPHIRRASQRPVSNVEWTGIVTRNDLARRAEQFQTSTLSEGTYRGCNYLVKYTGRFIKAAIMPTGRTRVHPVSGPMASIKDAEAWARKAIDQHLALEEQSGLPA